MSFVDQYLPEAVPGYPCISSPRTRTSIQVTAGGNERRNRGWDHPLYRFSLPEAPGRDPEVIFALRDHWLAMRGPFHSFPFQDPLDKASIALKVPNEPDNWLRPRIRPGDQVIGTGDGVTERFQLVKKYTAGPASYQRRIHLPVLSSVKVAVDGVTTPGITVSRPGGVVEFTTAPADGAVITAGFMFDVEVRFEDDDVFEGIVRTFQVGGFAELSLIEVRPC